MWQKVPKLSEKLVRHYFLTCVFNKCSIKMRLQSVGHLTRDDSSYPNVKNNKICYQKK